MGLTLIVPPQREVISLAEAKAHCRITHSEHDALIAGNIMGAAQYVQEHLRRSLLTQTWKLTLDYDWPSVRENGHYRRRIVLPRPPVQSVSSIEFIDRQGIQRTLEPTDHTKAAKLETGEWCIEPSYRTRWPEVRRQLATIVVTYITGYGEHPGNVPEPIRQAMLLLIGHWRENPEAASTAGVAQEIAFGVTALLSPYRVLD